MAFNLDNYEDVDTRIHRFWETYPNGRIATKIVHQRENAQGQLVQIIIQAQVFCDAKDIAARAMGLAEETFGSSPVNRTSMVENCETSAIGRALSTAGLSSRGARASRQEMQKVERIQAEAPARNSAIDYRTNNQAASPKQREYITKLLADRDWLVDEYRELKSITGTMNKTQAGEFIEWLQERPVTAADINRIGKPLEIK